MLTTISSCKKRDPNPENKDKVYIQLQADLAAAKTTQTYVNDYIKENQDSLSKAVPQSGEESVFKKRVNEGSNKLTYANQQVRMYEVRIEERKIYVQRRYLESFSPSGRKWPDDLEANEELLKLQMLREKVARINDSLPRPEVKDVPRGTKDEKEKESDEKKNKE